MSKSNPTEGDVLALIFKKTTLPWDASVNLEIHLHTADPGEGGISTDSEATFTGYAAVSVARSGAAWTGTNPVSNAALLQFPQCTGGTNVITHVSITPAGSTQILYSGALAAALTIANLIQAQFAIGALQIAED